MGKSRTLKRIFLRAVSLEPNAPSIHHADLSSELQPFAQGVQAGAFAFLTQDVRAANGTVGANRSAKEQAQQTLTTLDTALHAIGG